VVPFSKPNTAAEFSGNWGLSVGAGKTVSLPEARDRVGRFTKAVKVLVFMGSQFVRIAPSG
jgi:hypothetical protein